MRASSGRSWKLLQPPQVDGKVSRLRSWRPKSMLQSTLVWLHGKSSRARHFRTPSLAGYSLASSAVTALVVDGAGQGINLSTVRVHCEIATASLCPCGRSAIYLDSTKEAGKSLMAQHFAAVEKRLVSPTEAIPTSANHRGESQAATPTFRSSISLAGISCQPGRLAAYGTICEHPQTKLILS